MSRFVRASKYRHVFGQQAKKEHNIENVKVTNSAWDTNIVSASGQYLSVNWNASGGGAFAILPLPSPFHGINSFPHKLPDQLPLARSHSAPVLDTDWSPHNDTIVASGGEDGKAMIWKVEAALFEGWGAEGWIPHDFDPVLRIDASPRKIGQVLFHPTAAQVLATVSGEHTIKLWDLAAPEDPRVTLSGHGDAVQSLTFNPTGTLLATTCRDRKLRIFDPRTGGQPVRIADGHSGVKGARLAWMGEHDRIASTGFSKMSDRQIGIWDSGSLESLKMTTIDQSAGVLMPFWSDNNILFLAGKGDGNIRYYEYENDSLFALAEHKSSDPQRGVCFLPRRALNVAECEIARAYKLHGSTIEPIAFIVPRKADSFQSDIFPPAPSREPSLSASEFFNGKIAPLNLINLGDGSMTSGAQPSPAPAPSFTSSPPVSRTPTLTTAAPAPAPAQAPAPAPSQPSPPPSAAPLSAVPRRGNSGSEESTNETTSALKEENTRLTSDLRDAREKRPSLSSKSDGSLPCC